MREGLLLVSDKERPSCKSNRGSTLFRLLLTMGTVCYSNPTPPPFKPGNIGPGILGVVIGNLG